MAHRRRCFIVLILIGHFFSVRVQMDIKQRCKMTSVGVLGPVVIREWSEGGGCEAELGGLWLAR